MAIQNVPGMYSPFSAVVNTSPSVSFYANLLARKQAKEDALDEYYRRLPSTINEQGVRDQDRGVINQQINDAQKFWMENRDKIRNPNLDKGAAQLQYEQMFRQSKETVDKSKQGGKTHLEFGKLLFQPGNEYLKDDPDIMNHIKRAELPVNDPEYQELNMAELTRPPKPFGVKEQGDFFKTAVGELKPRKVYDEKNTRSDKTSGQVFVPYNEMYKDEQIKTIADNAGNLVKENPSAKRFYNNMMHDPKWFEGATKAYQSVYGANDIVDTEEKAAKAAAIIRSQTPVGQGEEPRADTQLAFQRQKELANYRAALQDSYVKGRIDYRKAKSATDGDTILNETINDWYNNGTKDLVYLNGNWVGAKKIPVPREIQDKYFVPGKYTGEKDLPLFFMTDDKKFVIPRYPGKSSANVVSQPIPIDIFKADIAKAWMTKKDEKAELEDEFTFDEDVTPIAPKPKKASATKTRPPLSSFVK